MLKPKDKRIEIIPEGEQKIVDVCREGIEVGGGRKTLTLRQGENIVEYNGSEDKEFEVADVDLTDYYTKTETDTLLNGKQNTLTAGDNISITNNTISATYTATDGIKIENGVIKLDPATALTALGYEEVIVQTTDEANDVVSVSVVGKVNTTRGASKMAAINEEGCPMLTGKELEDYEKEMKGENYAE